MIVVGLWPWWNACGVQDKNPSQSLFSPRIISTASMPSSMKSSGCGSKISSTPSRSQIDSSSSIERRKIASAVSGASGRPLNLEFIRVGRSRW
jgi:hypothetical protein